MFMVDDMGYSDIGCFGVEVRTPNIDWLAENGVRLRQLYTNPARTPTPGALLTGRYARQAGVATDSTWPSYNPNLGEEEHKKVLATRGISFWQHYQFPAHNTPRTDTRVTIGEALRATLH